MAKRNAQNLVKEIARLQALVAAQRAQIDEQAARIKELEKYAEELKSALAGLSGKNLSTPSSQKATYEKAKEDKAKAEKPKKKKGRPKGAKGSTRKRLTIEDVEDTRVVEENGCPHEGCGCRLSKMRKKSQIVETVVPAKRLVIEYIWTEGECPEHGKVTWRPGDARKGNHLSTEVLLIAAELVVGSGMSLEKTCKHLKKRFGIELTTGGLARAIQQLSIDMTQEVNAIERAIADSDAVHADETGGRVDGSSWWIWGFVTRMLASFRIEPGRGADVIFRVLGEDFVGVLMSDFYSAYNVPNCPKQKCLAHLLRSIQEILEEYEGNPGRPPPALQAMKQWAKDALLLKDKKDVLAESTFRKKRAQLEKRLDRILVMRTGNADVARLLKRLATHRDALLLFLYHEDVEGTNNRMERAIRKAVIQRKVNGGHRSWAGAQAYVILLSILVSCDFQERDFVKTGLDILERHYRGLPAGVLA